MDNVEEGGNQNVPESPSVDGIDFVRQSILSRSQLVCERIMQGVLATLGEELTNFNAALQCIVNYDAATSADEATVCSMNESSSEKDSSILPSLEHCQVQMSNNDVQDKSELMEHLMQKLQRLENEKRQLLEKYESEQQETNTFLEVVQHGKTKSYYIRIELIHHVGISQPKFALEIKIELENITDLQPKDFSSYRWHLKFCCSRCKESSDRWSYVSVDETVEIPGSRGTAHFVEKCKFCDCINNMSILPESFEPYIFSRNNEWQKIIAFECRGLEPIDFEPRGIWMANGVESSTTFEDINLDDKEWADFDEEAQKSVGILKFESRFSKIR